MLSGLILVQQYIFILSNSETDSKLASGLARAMMNGNKIIKKEEPLEQKRAQHLL
jgi:hypothetical protein